MTARLLWYMQNLVVIDLFLFITIQMRANGNVNQIWIASEKLLVKLAKDQSVIWL